MTSLYRGRILTWNLQEHQWGWNLQEHWWELFRHSATQNSKIAYKFINYQPQPLMTASLKLLAVDHLGRIQSPDNTLNSVKMNSKKHNRCAVLRSFYVLIFSIAFSLILLCNSIVSFWCEKCKKLERSHLVFMWSCNLTIPWLYEEDFVEQFLQ